MKFQLPIVPSRPQQWIKKTMKRLANNFTKLTIGSPQTWSRRQSNSFSAPIFFPTTIYPPATSGNFHPPTTLHSSCHYLTPAIFRCHLPMGNVKITHGHSFTGRPFIPLSKFYLRARSDQQTGLTTRILNVATYQPLGHSFLAERYPTATRRYHLGQKENSWMRLAKRARASKTSLLGRCTEGPVTTLLIKLEATRKLSLV